MRSLIKVSAVIVLSSWSAGAAEVPPDLYLLRSIGELREYLGKPLLDTVIDVNNKGILGLHTLSAQGSTFAYNAGRTPNESFDSLRQRSHFAVSFTTCPGSKEISSKISSIIAWERLETNTLQTSYVAVYLQKILESINLPPSITNPSTIRAPRIGKLTGLVFEYVKGDTTENVSLIDELDLPQSNALRFSWQATNMSYCPKQ